MTMLRIREAIEESMAVKKKLLEDTGLLMTLEKIVDECVSCLNNKGKVLFCGNGGSAADAQHLAAELTGKFYFDRAPLHAEALHVNTSFLTAVANDYSYEEVFSRLVRAKGQPGDVLVGLSTSGNSGNVVRALETAVSMQMVTVGLMGQKQGAMDAHCNYSIHVPSTDTPRIQEAHILIGHILCEMIERRCFPSG
jgi:D-sedoheptulose 7-phosphate isomerase